MLDQLVSDPRYGVPMKLLANRLALSAATATSKLEGTWAYRAADVPALWDCTMTTATRKRTFSDERDAGFDRELNDLPPELR